MHHRLPRMPGLALVCASLFAATGALGKDTFAPDQIKRGATIFAENCAACHGAKMADPKGAFDLRTFEPDQKNRFVNSVMRGKNNMPPWGDLFGEQDIEALWAYVMAGEPK
jgi:mono/diheme cytochrome c family protein